MAATQILTLYHGTDGANREAIVSTQFFANAGRIGKGVYFTPDKEVAESVARHRGRQWLVFECRVRVRAVYDYDRGCKSLPKRRHDWARHGFDAATAMHPPWAGVAVPLPEVCVRDPAAVTIVGCGGLDEDKKTVVWWMVEGSKGTGSGEEKEDDADLMKRLGEARGSACVLRAEAAGGFDD